jgi:FlaA1/EpsC-like NDP-sugar epimerase
MNETTAAPNKQKKVSPQQHLVRAAQRLVDLLVCAMAFRLAYLLRFDFAIPPEVADQIRMQLPTVMLLKLVTLGLFGIQAFVWRYVGMADLRAFTGAAVASTGVLLAARYGLPDSWLAWRVPLSVILLDGVFSFGGLVAIRVLRRWLYELRKADDPPGEPRSRAAVLLIGAGRAGVMAAREIQSNRELRLDVRGFVDDDPNKKGVSIQGVKVLGTTQDLPKLTAAEPIDHVVVTIEQLSRTQFKRLRDICEAIPIKMRIAPSMSEILDGRLTVSRIRDVQVEDLLGRAPVDLDLSDLARLIGGRTVMVTGAGGSIGSELVRQVARFAPKQLLLAERSEFALFNIEREMRRLHAEIGLVPVLADVGSEGRMRTVFEQFRPSLVLHAAAHKHVPMLEYNPTEAITNNVLATRTLAQLAGEHGVEVFVLISTDKAVNPTSIMGASKRLTELVIQSVNRSWDTRYVAVRFGNVIGSAGSVVPIFQEQIRKGGPVVVTSPDMVRYFMTIPEAAQLVLQAASMGNGGEIFVLDMGEPVRILDLAKETIRLSGFRPFVDIDITFSGLRPGEKLFEELELSGEQTTRTRHPKIFIGKLAPYPDHLLDRAIDKLTVLALEDDELGIRTYLNELLPEAKLSKQRADQSTASGQAPVAVSHLETGRPS